MKTPKGIELIDFSRNWIVFLTWGIILTILGFIAISAAVAATLITVVLFGALLFIGGVVILIDAFTFWRHRPGFMTHLIMGLLYLLAGVVLVVHPVASSITLTLILGALFLVLGLFRLVYSFSLRTPQWGWNFFNGLLTLLLGIIILANWPAASLVIIGLFVGIDLLFCGIAYIMAALSVRTLS